jgi:glucose/arabinose dehydrogenase
MLVIPDGALLLSDSQAGVVFRVTYKKRSTKGCRVG